MPLIVYFLAVSQLSRFNFRGDTIQAASADYPQMPAIPERYQTPACKRAE